MLAALLTPAAAFGQELGNIKALEGLAYTGPEIEVSNVEPAPVFGDLSAYDPAQGPASLVSAA